VIAIVQARMGSTRLPNKVMQLIDGVPMIELLFKRLSNSSQIDKIILATSNNPKNAPLIDHIRNLGYGVYEGSENDVLDRYYQISKEEKARSIVRITGDCPLVDSDIVDQVIDLFHNEKADYASNTAPPTFPDGLDVSVFTFEALKIAWRQASKDTDREHVTSFIRNSSVFKTVNLLNPVDLSSERWTVDEIEDVEVIDNVFKYFSPYRDFSWHDVMKLRKSQPKLFLANTRLIRNEGETISSGQKLWKRAKLVIPGGNMLLSKRSEMFLPDQWPAYFSKTKDCRVWDMDGREYIDMSIMGIGTNILGYSHPEVDEAVHNIVELGNMSTFNCPEEVYLAEKLIELHPWADMARFARSGGEANAIAIRIARAASGKDKVAICGYHGWHDWYLSANLNSKHNLTEHLLPGLDPKGVPQNLEGTTLPFRYNDFEELERLVNQNPDLGVIKMEVKRNEEPKSGFLEKVRMLATKKGIVLIFDECTSGFRETFGGLHKKYGVEPDMAIFGKALGNGYAITAIIGRREVMEAAQTTFISSTFWTERIGPTAALKTLEVMERDRSWEQVTKTGNNIAKLWKELANKYDLPLRVFGLPSLIKFSFDSPHALYYKTLITQEMLSKGYLSGNSVYVCTKHTPEIISGYIQELEMVFKLIQECENGRDIKSLLNGPVCHSEFKRLN
jgi:glutamate-1-semialdehyde 2,1-aminomutase